MTLPARSRAVPLFIALLLAIGLASWGAALAVVRRGYGGLFPAAGTMAALADAVLRGQAPGHEDGRAFMATYYFPPFPTMVAAAHRAGLGWLDALRACTLLSALLLLGAAGWAAAALGAGRRGALLAPALVMATFTFKASALDGRADLLAAAFSLAALAAWIRDEESRGWKSAAFAAAAFLTRAASVAVPLAMVAWALRHRQGAALGRFGARFAACALGGVLLLAPFHGPAWYLDVLRALLSHASGRSNLIRGPEELVRYAGAFSEVAAFAAFTLVLLTRRSMRDHPVAAYCGAAFVITLYVMTGFASGPNHLVEPAAAVATCAAVWAAPRLSRLALLPALVLGLVVLGASWRDLLPVLRYAGAPGNGRERVIDAVRTAPGEALTEDALISLAAGRRPAVSDMDALRAMALTGDPRARAIVAGLERRRFALVVLNDDLEASERWYRGIRFTDLTIAPLRAGYRPAGMADGFHLYRAAGP
jgi:hypothetical protein